MTGEVTRVILEALRRKGASNPGDIVADTGLPRYLVLAAFQILHELGYIKLVYNKGSHKVYMLSDKGLEYLSEPVKNMSVEAAEAST